MNSLLKVRQQTAACSPLFKSFVRHGHRIRGKPPLVAKTLSQRLAEDQYEDPVLHAKVNIGFSLLKPSRSVEFKQRFGHLMKQRKDLNLEKLARNHKLEIDLDESKYDYFKTSAPFHIKKIAEHYGIFEHLFGRYAYFVPRVSMDIKFQLDDGTDCPVYCGNRIKPCQTKSSPEVSFEHNNNPLGDPKSNEPSLWTLILTNPDGHFTQENKEYVHWMIGNIPNGEVSKGETIVPYLQAFPPKGIGYQRHVFILYKQDKKMDYKDLIVTEPTSLEKRTFSTYDFYRERQDLITPAGLSFFQSNWDSSLSDFYHKVLNMKEPIFDYDYPNAYIKDQAWYPLKEPFNLYLDRYSDPKDVNKRYLERKLAKTHPFEGPEPPMRYPNAHNLGNVPSWLKTEIRKDRLKIGRINDVEN